MSTVLEFADFRLDIARFELQRSGRSLKLEKKPMELLILLAEGEGQLVSRDLIAERLWGKEVFVDTEHGINTAVRKIRQVLCDDPESPRFVQTVTGKGYRFLSTVEVRRTPATGSAEPSELPALPSSSANPAVEHPNPVISLPLDHPSEPVASVHGPSPLPKWRKRTFTMAVLAVAVLTLVGFISKSHWPGTKPAAYTVSHLVAGGWQPALSPDGKLVAYLANRGSGPLHIWVSQTSGAGAIEVTSGPFEDYQPDFSPDGTRIVFVSGRNGHGIFTTSALPGEVKPLVVNTTASLPRFSPTGDRVLYLQDSKLFVIWAAGGKPTALLPDQPFTFNGAAYWSPDGSEILFYGVRTADRTTPAAWWIAPVGKGQPRLARLPGTEDTAEKDLAVRAWVRTADDREWMVYTTSEPNNWKLWRLQVTWQGKTYQPQLLAEGTGGIAPLGSAARDGSVAYVVAHEQRSIYQVHLDHHGERSGPTEDLLSNYGGINTSPSVSRDGRWMAYDSALQGKAESIRLRDLAGSADTQLEELGRQFADYNATSIAPDGSKVIFSRMCRPGEFTSGSPGSPPDCGFLVNAAGDRPEQVCEGCIARGFSADGSYVLLQKEGEGAELETISALSLKTRKQRTFFASPVPHEELYHPFLSWDDRWVVFKTIPDANVAHSQLMIAPMHEGLAEGASRWIPITNGQSSDDKPQFSADGNTVFYTSGRDGFLCIWAQKLNPQTKRPSGPAVAFEHFHNPAGRGWIYAQGIADLSVARDKLLIALPQIDFGVWITKAE